MNNHATVDCFEHLILRHRGLAGAYQIFKVNFFNRATVNQGKSFGKGGFILEDKD